jgi:hypothetical protein
VHAYCNANGEELKTKLDVLFRLPEAAVASYPCNVRRLVDKARMNRNSDYGDLTIRQEAAFGYDDCMLVISWPF